MGEPAGPPVPAAPDLLPGGRRAPVVQLPSWPGLRNPYANEPVQVRQALLDSRNAAPQKPWRRRRYLGRRAIRRFVQSVVYEATRMPVRTLYDVLTGLPLGLLAWPAYRDWLVL